MRKGAIGFLLTLTLAPVSLCQSQELARSVRLTVENDAFDFWLLPD